MVGPFPAMRESSARELLEFEALRIDGVFAEAAMHTPVTVTEQAMAAYAAAVPMAG